MSAEQVYIPRLSRDVLVFPDPLDAIDEGLLAFGGDLTPSRLLAAYRKGIFPWYSQGDPILWWSPNPRLVLFPDDFRMSRSFRKTLKKRTFEIRSDTAFRTVMENCRKAKRKDQEGTWILPEVIDAYCELHALGYAHSFEAYSGGELVGGLYGVCLGGGFFGESMFAKASDASKAALAGLVAFSQAHGFDFIDCQVTTEHLMRLGAVEVTREHFLEMVAQTLKKETIFGQWDYIHT